MAFDTGMTHQGGNATMMQQQQHAYNNNGAGGMMSNGHAMAGQGMPQGGGNNAMFGLDFNGAAAAHAARAHARAQYEAAVHGFGGLALSNGGGGGAPMHMGGGGHTMPSMMMQQAPPPSATAQTQQQVGYYPTAAAQHSLNGGAHMFGGPGSGGMLPYQEDMYPVMQASPHQLLGQGVAPSNGGAGSHRGGHRNKVVA